MEVKEIKVGDVVRHRNIMQGTNLSVVSIEGDKLVVRYASQGLFQTQELLLNEVELFVEDERELF
jgi:hypothetical protein